MAQRARHNDAMTENIHDGWQAREYHKLAIGGVLFNLDFRANDANALEALLRMPVADFRKLRLAMADNREAGLAQVLRRLIDENELMLDAEGRSHVLERRRETYLAAAESWKCDGDQRTNAAWRDKYMTKGQRYLIHQVCLAKNIEPPEGLTRGGASDWLEANGAHHIYRKD